mgnify:CR=1 FL=1|jgi:hypothetical protein
MRDLPASLIIILICSTTLFAQEEYESAERVACFNGDQEYHFRALYIDCEGDTITNEKMVLRPLGRPWFFQMRYQVAVKYIYHTDTSDYKNYLDPDKWWQEKNQKHYDKKGEYRLSEDETTGAIAKRGIIYMHPPRTNQYRLLSYTPHPFVYTKAMTASIFNFSRSLEFIGMGGPMIQDYTVIPLGDTTVNNSKVRAWNIWATSGGDFNDFHESQDFYDSTMVAIVTKEYGFIKMHYTFKNNIKIQFDLEEVKMLN